MAHPKNKCNSIITTGAQHTTAAGTRDVHSTTRESGYDNSFSTSQGVNYYSNKKPPCHTRGRRVHTTKRAP